ncbi:hypothetical protein SAMN05443663_109145 [Flavobacterium defluvii]|uniref:Uncharacterized protein n=2 Tax=Flavobacterium defluvii TaxID=370979 RepID=A0A1M5USJ1_9FLAO|nr:hypothetical protein SAMN05443663_109145 [Flavobacterium defluvii]
MHNHTFQLNKSPPKHKHMRIILPISIIVSIISILSYSCEALPCDDENDRRDQNEAFFHKVDTLDNKID